jgi:hypothetical protein
VLLKGKTRAKLAALGKAGANKLRFKPRRLAPGRYQLIATPVNGGKPRSIGFTVKHR